ncbi:MAG TPA: hypothetical protein VIL84_00360 [Devosiaceae bacterium]
MTGEEESKGTRPRTGWTPEATKKGIALLAVMAFVVWAAPELHFWEHGWNSLRSFVQIVLLLALVGMPVVRRAIGATITLGLLLLAGGLPGFLIGAIALGILKTVERTR